MFTRYRVPPAAFLELEIRREASGYSRWAHFLIAEIRRLHSLRIRLGPRVEGNEGNGNVTPLETVPRGCLESHNGIHCSFRVKCCPTVESAANHRGPDMHYFNCLF